MDLDHRGHRGSTGDVHAGVSGRILKAAFKVHTALGPGLLESAYETCLCYELASAGLEFRRQVGVPIKYDNRLLDCGFRLDLLVEGKVIVEVKSVERLVSLHESPLLSYLRASGIRLGLLINFNVLHLRHGIRRRVL